MKHLLLAVINFLFYTTLSFAQPAETGKQDISKPEGKVSTSSTPDYSNLFYWASHPAKQDAGDKVPAFLKNEKRDTLGDVFFLHPTTYTGRMKEGDWNADVNDVTLNNYTDNRSIANQATIFNGSCKVYAPRYRQVHIRSFFTFNNPQATKAFDVAYKDIKDAFEYYLKHHNNGRPIVIASHSQGSLHAIRLLKEFFDGKPLQKQLVCAYVVGWQIKPTDLKSIKLGESPDATGCIVGWRTYKKGASDWLLQNENGNGMVVNPLTWTTNVAWVSASAHKGMLDRNFNKLAPVKISAGIDPKLRILGVEIEGDVEGLGNFGNNYHVADFNLFYMNVRENVKTRLQAFLQQKNL